MVCLYSMTTGCTQYRFLRRSFLLPNRRAHTYAVSVKTILYWKKNSCQQKQLFRCSARTFTETVLAPQQFCYQCAPSLNHNRHCRANTSTTIEHESHTRKCYKRDINPDSEFSKFKNVGTVNQMILKLSNNSQCASNETITCCASQQDLNRGKGCELT